MSVRSAITSSTADVSIYPSGGNDWQSDLLNTLHADHTMGNSMGLALWAASEGMPPETFNWLAVTDKRPGSRDYNGAGVQEYPSYDVGIEVLHRKFTGALYLPIGRALQSGDARTLFEAINSSPWCSGCQGGEYPIALLRWIEAGQGANSPTPVIAERPPPQQTGPSPDSWDDKVRFTGVASQRQGAALTSVAGAILDLSR